MKLMFKYGASLLIHTSRCCLSFLSSDIIRHASDTKRPCFEKVINNEHIYFWPSLHYNKYTVSERKPKKTMRFDYCFVQIVL